MSAQTQSSLMSPDVKATLALYGVESLPWQRCTCEYEAWECKVRGTDLCFLDTKQGWKISLTPSGESYNHFKHSKLLPYGEVDVGMRALMISYVAPDPRFTGLSDDLRALAEQFLDVHNAWATGFLITGHEWSFNIEWWTGTPDEYQAPFAEFKLVKDERNRFSTIAPWWSSWSLRWVGKDEAGAAVGRLPVIRRCSDFAEFVRCFRTS